MNDESLNGHFTRSWVRNKSAAWPEAADSRILRDMLLTDHYFPSPQVMRGESLKTLQIRLTRQTQLEWCKVSSEDFISFDSRLYRRICYLSDALKHRDIIKEHVPHKWTKTDAFQKAWREHNDSGNKFKYWAKKSPITAGLLDQPVRIEQSITVQEADHDSGSEYSPPPSTFDREEYADEPITETQDGLIDILLLGGIAGPKEQLALSKPPKSIEPKGVSLVLYFKLTHILTNYRDCLLVRGF